MPRRPTPERLQRRAIAYLERYASSAGNLRHILLRRALRDARHHEMGTAEVESAVDAIIARFIASGLLDDSGYALSKARSMLDAGRSERMIRLTLRSKGVADVHIDGALQRLGEETGRVELRAALRLAERRRLGPWRPASDRQNFRRRDLAVMARAGFAGDMARRIIDADDLDELHAEVET